MNMRVLPMKAIAVDQVDQTGQALVVRYQHVGHDPAMVSVQITAQTFQGTANHVERSEVTVICAEEMPVSDMEARVEAEGEGRQIECVAWIDEGSAS
jgi:hypothetical protein